MEINMKIEPLTPNEVSKYRIDSIPSYVIDAFNKLIAKYWSEPNKQSIVMQDSAVQMIKELASQSLGLELTNNFIFDNNMLDIEALYRSKGWTVVYDKPAYNESYEASFTFGVAE
jgi:hypothetical protein